jgi:CRISPR-associated protein Csy2
MSAYLLIRRMRVHAANAISGPLTYGFPSITAFLGFGHALQRHIRDADPQLHGQVSIRGVGVISHSVEMLDHRERYERTLRITANPITKDGKRPSFVEEGRCHLTVSILLEIDGVRRETALANLASDVIAGRMKLAGGDIHEVPEMEWVADDRQAIRRMMPGYVLMDRANLLADEMQPQNGGGDALDALHRLVAIESRSESVSFPNGGADVKWTASRRRAGWLVPIAIGYQALSPPELATGARDTTTPHRFAEAVTSLGEFVLASRIERLADVIWRYQVENDLYLVRQDQRPRADSLESLLSNLEVTSPLKKENDGQDR